MVAEASQSSIIDVALDEYVSWGCRKWLGDDRKKVSEKSSHHLEPLVLIQEPQVIEDHEGCEVYCIEMLLVSTFWADHPTFERCHETCLLLSHLLYKKQLDLSAQVARSWSSPCVRRRPFPKVGGLSRFNAEAADDETTDYSNP